MRAEYVGWKRLTLLFLKIVLISLLLFVFLYLRYYEI
jgi:hypothetical protein